MRGALYDPVRHGFTSGIIPACAGSTSCVMILRFGQRDHPRMCGEHLGAERTLSTDTGSSPHVRGARGESVQAVHASGIIPACAGSTNGTGTEAGAGRDHPRMCGEHDMIKSAWPGAQGSSPHVRGAPGPSHEHDVLVGIIPACAGSTPTRMKRAARTRDHPRMCGEHL